MSSTNFAWSAACMESCNRSCGSGLVSVTATQQAAARQDRMTVVWGIHICRVVWPGLKKPYTVMRAVLALVPMTFLSAVIACSKGCW